MVLNSVYMYVVHFQAQNVAVSKVLQYAATHELDQAFY